MAEQLSLSNPVFASFVLYATVLILKLFAMSLLTTLNRVTRGVFASPEDYKAFKGDHETKSGYDPHIERIRRAHLNDLENILPFLVLGFFYVLTSPGYATANGVFQVFAGARILHSLVYVWEVRQPARFFFFLVGMAVNLYMSLQVLRAVAF